MCIIDILQCAWVIIWGALCLVAGIIAFIAIGLWSILCFIYFGLTLLCHAIGRGISNAVEWLQGINCCSCGRKKKTDAHPLTALETPAAETYQHSAQMEAGGQSQPASEESPNPVEEPKPVSAQPPSYRENAEITVPEPVYDPRDAVRAGGKGI